MIKASYLVAIACISCFNTFFYDAHCVYAETVVNLERKAYREIHNRAEQVKSNEEREKQNVIPKGIMGDSNANSNKSESIDNEEINIESDKEVSNAKDDSASEMNDKQENTDKRDLENSNKNLFVLQAKDSDTLLLPSATMKTPFDNKEKQKKIKSLLGGIEVSEDKIYSKIFYMPKSKNAKYSALYPYIVVDKMNNQVDLWFVVAFYNHSTGVDMNMPAIDYSYYNGVQRPQRTYFDTLSMRINDNVYTLDLSMHKLNYRETYTPWSGSFYFSSSGWDIAEWYELHMDKNVFDMFRAIGNSQQELMFRLSSKKYNLQHDAKLPKAKIKRIATILDLYKVLIS